MINEGSDFYYRGDDNELADWMLGLLAQAPTAAPSSSCQRHKPTSRPRRSPHGSTGRTPSC